MGKKSNGMVWPYAIGIAVTLVFSFGVITVIVTAKADVQLSDNYMTYYQDADVNANKYIKAKIKFDKSYKVSYINNGLKNGTSNISYKVTDINDNPIRDAKIILAISRPETNDFNKQLDKFTQKDGVYTFSNVKLNKVGKWNLIAKINVGDDYEFLNIKADTRDKKYKKF